MCESFLFLLFFEQVYHIMFVCVHIGLGLRTRDVEHNLGDVGYNTTRATDFGVLLHVPCT
jgi:hypothetical protein